MMPSSPDRPAHAAEPAVHFSFKGRDLVATPGQSVAAAAQAAGIRQLTRSLKYRRPRGIYCASGNCPNCLLRVDGLPYTRTCVTEVREGMVVENNKPGPLDRLPVDPLRVIDLVGFAFPLGFQYRYFKRQGRLYRLWERRLRRVAGDAAMPDPAGPGPSAETVSTDLLVVGAGPAGIGAAISGAEAGLDVVLVSRWWRADAPGILAGRWRSAQLPIPGNAPDIASHPRIRVLAPANAVAAFDGTFLVDHDGGLVEVTPARSILATGAYERALTFDRNDLPGVLLTSAALKLLQRDGVRPGSRAVLVTRDDTAYDAAWTLQRGGVHVVGLFDERDGPSDPELATMLGQLGVPVFGGMRTCRGVGFGKLRGIVVASGGRTRRLRCDLVCMSGGWQAADDLRYQATSHGQALVTGDRAQPVDWGSDHATPADLLQGVGAVVGTFSPLQAFHEGRIAALHAARHQGLHVDQQLSAAIVDLGPTRGG